MEPASLDAAFWISTAVVLVLLCFSAFFSGSETALTAASRGKLRAAADRGDKGAARALEVKEDDERFIGAILMGNNLANIVATSLATAALTTLFGANGVAVASLVMTALILIFAEVLPKTYAISAPERAAGIAAPVIARLMTVLSPFVTAVRMLVRATLRIFGVRVAAEDNILSVHEEIAGALSIGHSEGVVEKEDRDRILGALDLGERFVEEIMLHRSGIEMIDAGLPPREILRQVLESQHTRLPLYRDRPENIVGVLHAKELLRAMHGLAEDGDVTAEELSQFDVMDVAMEPYFVPDTTTLDDQMREFLKRHTHFALVVDEYGTLQGLITLEDILEEIVGEITDEFDTGETDSIRPTDDGAYLIDGGTTIRDVNRANDWTLPDDEANTIAGLVIHEAQMIPAEGQVFSFHGFRFEVVEKHENRLAVLKIRPL
ncbi:HlyC/CorC family transporter [Histidinibacterium lentulum]|uniref:HlyC/CorC family transporter n=1 Tax=Histidinibacterium lentulum TaxID=2480588 RepID=A0A3N2QKY0_9RHOB|nr:HlyC/CorC family transporter [Histidinibacterium lentulum]ROT95844.1 HlyC/CorC family transporter [Histidinibacterium lentulum]